MMRIIEKTFILLLAAALFAACGSDNESKSVLNSPNIGGADGANSTGGTDGADATGGIGGVGGGAGGLDAAGGAGGLDSAGGAGGLDAAGGAGGIDAADGVPIETLLQRIAISTCGAINRCCNDGEIDLFWSSISNHPRFEEINATLPPQTPYDPDNCEETVERAYDVAPFGDWIDAVDRGLASYDANAATTCLNALDAAACGQDLINTLYDGTCFAFQPPVSRNRNAFDRLGNIGDQCLSIADGAAGTFYGTCDPTNAWCATEVDDQKRITAAGALGTCVAAAQINEPCGLFPSATICARGSSCSVDGICEDTERVGTAMLGEPCFNTMTFTTLATCEVSYCDMTGTGHCEALKVNDDACIASYECLSGNCIEAVCSARSYCGGL